jgi:hypothetical protein
LPESSDTSSPFPVKSTASRWLETFHPCQLTSSQTQVCENAGLGLDAIPPKQASSVSITGLPRSSISQWPLSPDLTGRKTVDIPVSVSEPVLGSASPWWSLCPQSSPLSISETFETSCVLSSASSDQAV